MKRLFISTLYVLPLIVWGCSKEVVKTGEVPLILPQDDKATASPSNYQYWSQEGKQTLGIFNQNESQIYLYDLNAIDQLPEILPIAAEDQTAVGFDFLSSDSLIYLSGDLSSLVLVDRTGKVLQRWNTEDDRLSQRMGLQGYFLTSLNFSPVKAAYPYVYCSFFPAVKVENLKVIFRNKAVMKITLPTEDSLPQLGLMVNYPSCYRGAGRYYGRIGSLPSYCLTTENQLLVSFPADPNLYLYDAQTGSSLQTIPAPSEFIDQMNPLKGNPGDQSAMGPYTVKEPMYYKILQDPETGYYFRICLHRQPVYQGESQRMNAFEEKPWSVLVLNSDFSVVAEHYFAPRTHSFRNVFAAAGYLWVGNYSDPVSPSRELLYSKFRVI